MYKVQIKNQTDHLVTKDDDDNYDYEIKWKDAYNDSEDADDDKRRYAAHSLNN